MPWKETVAMDERMRFVTELLSDGETMSALCEAYGVSRKTGYKWKARYLAHGASGLAPRSSAPVRKGRALDPQVVEAVLALRERFPRWGAKKLRVKLAELHPGLTVPAPSTIGAWLLREGLSERARRRHRTPRFVGPFTEVVASNAVWCIDFKGWFLTGDGRRCDPLTVTDAHSRYLLACDVVAAQDEASVRPVFERLFRQHGLPGAILSDNGTPFATIGAGGLSKLSIWFLKLGIKVERITPGRPQQNGRHERMHRTLKAATASPPEATLRLQQAAFDKFRREFNEERPHEGLELKTPASVYENSGRAYPPGFGRTTYPPEHTLRRVRSNGQIKWGGDLVFVSHALAGECVGVGETEFGDWRVCFLTVELGYIDAPRRRLSRTPIRLRPKPTDLMDSADALPTTPQEQKPPQNARFGESQGGAPSPT